MTTTDSLRLGWIGLGSMGLAMATNIQKHLKEKSLLSLKYWNRTISRGDSLREIGGVPCLSPIEVLEDCDAIFISVSNSLHTEKELGNKIESTCALLCH